MVRIVECETSAIYDHILWWMGTAMEGAEEHELGLLDRRHGGD